MIAIITLYRYIRDIILTEGFNDEGFFKKIVIENEEVSADCQRNTLLIMIHLQSFCEYTFNTIQTIYRCNAESRARVVDIQNEHRSVIGRMNDEHQVEMKRRSEEQQGFYKHNPDQVGNMSPNSNQYQPGVGFDEEESYYGEEESYYDEEEDDKTSYKSPYNVSPKITKLRDSWVDKWGDRSKNGHNRCTYDNPYGKCCGCAKMGCKDWHPWGGRREDRCEHDFTKKRDDHYGCTTPNCDRGNHPAHGTNNKNPYYDAKHHGKR